MHVCEIVCVSCVLKKNSENQSVLFYFSCINTVQQYNKFGGRGYNLAFGVFFLYNSVLVLLLSFSSVVLL